MLSNLFHTCCSIRSCFNLSFWLSQGLRGAISVLSRVSFLWEPQSVISLRLQNQRLRYICWEIHLFSLDGYWIGIWLHFCLTLTAGKPSLKPVAYIYQSTRDLMACTLSYFCSFPFYSSFHIHLLLTPYSCIHVWKLPQNSLGITCSCVASQLAS